MKRSTDVKRTSLKGIIDYLNTAMKFVLNQRIYIIMRTI